MTCQDSFHEVAFNISFWTRNISRARILFWWGVASVLLECQSSLFTLPIAIANCFARGLELLQISSTLQVGLQVRSYSWIEIGIASAFASGSVSFECNAIFAQLPSICAHLSFWYLACFYYLRPPSWHPARGNHVLFIEYEKIWTMFYFL